MVAGESSELLTNERAQADFIIVDGNEVIVATPGSTIC